MKRFLILFILFTTVSQAQQVKTQKDILGLPNTDLIKDFNLKIGEGNIIPTKVVTGDYTDTGFPFLKKGFSYNKERYGLKTLVFKNKKLLKNTRELFYESGSYLENLKFGSTVYFYIHLFQQHLEMNRV